MMSNPLTVLDFFPVSERQKIQSILAESIIVDYGIVRSVTNNKTVDVEHAVRRVLMGGIQAEPIVQDARITYGVELLFPSSASFSQSWTVAVDDGVLLVGLQNVLPTTEGLTESAQPPEFWHYSSQTLKAIPLQAVNANSSVQFGENGGKAFLRNQAKSLYTLLDSLEHALATFMGATSQASITSGGSSSAALAAALVALMGAFTTATATMRTDLAALLEA
jgi:hypothetical protein